MGTCSICFDAIEDPGMTICLHIMCRYCLYRSLELKGQCP